MEQYKEHLDVLKNNIDAITSSSERSIGLIQEYTQYLNLAMLYVSSNSEIAKYCELLIQRYNVYLVLITHLVELTSTELSKVRYECIYENRREDDIIDQLENIYNKALDTEEDMINSYGLYKYYKAKQD
jgi:hypothetical protein